MLVNSGRNYLCPNHYRVENGWMNNNGFPYQSHGTGYMRGLALNNPTIPPQWFVDFPSLSLSLSLSLYIWMEFCREKKQETEFSFSLSLYIWMEFCREKKQETGVGTSVMGHDQSLPYRQEAGKGMQLKLSSYIMFNDLLKSSKASQVNFYLIPWTLYIVPSKTLDYKPYTYCFRRAKRRGRPGRMFWGARVVMVIIDMEIRPRLQRRRLMGMIKMRMVSLLS